MEKEKLTKEFAIKFFEKLNNEKKEDRELVFSFVYVGLISSDTCIDEDSCLSSLNDLMIFDKALEEAKMDETLRNEYKEMIKTGIKIVSRDLESFRNGDYGHC